MKLWRRRKKLKPNNDALREFVYLDEVSVYSLSASRFGALAKDFTATESRTLEAEASPSGGFDLAGVKATVGLKAKTAQTSGTQVVRKAIIQSTFKELYEHEQPTMLAGIPDGQPPTWSSKQAFAAALRDGKLAPWAFASKALERGRLLELPVELDAEDMYRFSVVVSSMLELVDGNEAAFGIADQGSVSEVAMMSRVLDKLLGGLIPLRGKVLSHQAVVVDGQEWVVHEKLLAAFDPGWGLNPQPIHVVGVTEASLFWKDVRRVLFAGSKYTVLCRVGRDDLQATWTPMKLADVLRTVVPGVAAQLDGGAGIMASLNAAAAAPSAEVDAERRMREAMVAYGTALATFHSKSWTEADRIAQGLPTPSQTGAYQNVSQRQEAFREFTTQLAGHLQIPRNADTERGLRAQALQDAGLQNGQWPAPVPDVSSQSQQLAVRYLDVEVVAIYW